MKKSEIWRYKYVILFLILDGLFLGFKSVIGQEIIDNTIVNFKGMLSVLPPIFLLLGLLEGKLHKKKTKNFEYLY